jgi:conjugal transfer pilus assembly protein TraK
MSISKKRKVKAYMGYIVPVIVLFLAIVVGASNVFALKTVELKEGVTEFVEISERDLNAIVFPVDVKVFTKSDNLEMKIQDKRVFVSFKSDMETGPARSPEQLYFLTDSKTYSMVLIPKGIPSETVIARIQDISEKEGAISWEKEQPYISAIKSLMKAMYTNMPPNGYEVAEADATNDVSKWTGLSQILNKKYSGASFIGEVYTVINGTGDVVRLREQEFYEKGVMALSIDIHELRPNEKTEVYVVRMLGGGNDPKGVFNPLGQ